MSGGQLVVLDRLGHDVKRYLLPEGLATIGSDPTCNIRVMLSSVSPHHATVVVHANQTVVRNVSTGETLVNGQPVSVAALRHKDLIELGGRILRWEYSNPAVERPLAPEPVLYSRGRGRTSGSGRSAGSARSQRSRRATAAAAASRRSPAVQLRLEMTHRASMPGGVGGKQVAIVQPQRRATAEQNDQSPLRQYVGYGNRPRATKSEGGSPEPSTILAEGDKSKRKAGRPVTSSPITLQGTTKATLWIESRKTSPRKTVKAVTPASAPAPKRRAVSAAKSTPLRLAVLKKHRTSLTKIQAPREIDPTKQAAIMLMAGRTPRPPAVLAKRTGSLRFTPKQPTTTTPRQRSNVQSVSLLEISDSLQSPSGPAFRRSPPVLASPMKSALRDPSVKKTSRKTDSIKFDLSNLGSHEQSQDVFMLSDATPATSYDTNASSEDENISLHYDTTNVSPSPRRSIHSRSSCILENTLGTSTGRSSTTLQQSTLTPGTPRNRKSSRGSVLVQKVLETSANERSKRYSMRTTKSVSDQSYDTTVESAFRTRTLSPRSPAQGNMESYSIVDLVSVDSNDSRSPSVYGSVRSRNSSGAAFGTPRNSVGRKTRSTIDPHVITSSTPYVGKTNTRSTRASSSPNLPRNSSGSDKTQVSRNSRRSKSLTTPENSQSISLNTTRVSRGPRSRSRINDSELMLISSATDVENSSPKSSKRLSKNDISLKSSPLQNRTSARKTRLTVNVTPNESPVNDGGMNTPENKASPEEVGTPMLSIQSLLDSSHSSSMSQKLLKKGRMSKRNTIGGIQKNSKGRPVKSKSFIFVARRSGRRQSKESSSASDKTETWPPAPSNGDIVTPKSGVKLVPEDVKNKHSTAKKPQSKRSIIDDLNDSDIVKQLFNSPVKRKLSQSMSEYSRKQLFDDFDVMAAKRPTRHTVANTGRTPEQSPLERTQAYSPGVFVSPLTTPEHSPNLTGIKRLFEKQTPEDGVGGEASSRSTRPRKSIKNDLTRVSGVKNVFTRSPRNRLSDVRVKELFAPLQKDDLSRVSGVKALFKTNTPSNDLRDVRGVKKLFSDSPVNDLRNVSGVKEVLRRNSPRNDLADVRGVRNMFRQGKESVDGLSNVSGVEELFNDSNQSLSGSSQSNRKSNQPPRKSTQSPRTSTQISRKSNQSPRKSTQSPRMSTQSSRKSTQSPRKSTQSPRMSTQSSRKSTQSPRKSTQSPRKSTQSSRKSTQSPRKSTQSPRKSTQSSRKSTQSPRKSTQSPRKSTQASRKSTPSSRTSNQSSRKSNQLHSNSNQSHNQLSQSQINVEASFDKLLGKPPVRAVYSRTFTTKLIQKPKLRQCKSLQISVGENTNNLEKWLKEQTGTRMHKVGAETTGHGRTSTSDKNNLSKSVIRELQKLTTDTLAGESPLCSSRARNGTIVSTMVIVEDSAVRNSRGRDSTIVKSIQDGSGQKRSASQLYSARKLPIKKRLWPSMAAASADLPIKKRTVLHSTPVKGPRALLDAFEQGRVSPIALDHTALDHLHLTSDQQTRDIQERDTEPAKDSSRIKSKIEQSRTLILTVSPKKTRASRITKETSAAGKTLRTRKTNNSRAQNVQKRRASLVVSKKAPVLTPQPATKTSRRKANNKKMSTENTKEKVENKEPIKSPTVTPKERTGRRKKIDSTKDKKVETTIKTPIRTTRAKVQRRSVVVSKPSPKMKPVSKKGKADVQPEQKKRTRKVTAPSEAANNVKGKQKAESPKESPVTRVVRSRRAVEVTAKPKGSQTKVAASPRFKAGKTKQEKRTKASKTDENASTTTRGRGLGKRVVEVAQVKKNVPEVTAASTRGKRAEPKPDTKKAAVVKATNTRNRNHTQQSEKIVEVPKTRRQKAELLPAQTKTASKAAVTRGKKTKEIEEVVTQESKRTRGKKDETDGRTHGKAKRVQSSAKTNVKNKTAEVKVDQVKRTKANETAQESKTTRSKKIESSSIRLDGKQGQKAKAKVEDKSRKRKNTVESEIPSKVRKTRNEDVAEAKGRGRKAVAVNEAKGGRETRKNVEKTHMTRRRMAADDVGAPAGRAGRGRQAGSSSGPQPASRKRKSVADTSNRGAGRKQPANKKPKVAETPKQRTRGRAAAVEEPKRATRARR